MRAHFAKRTKRAPRNKKLERAFLASKLRMLETHPFLDKRQRDAAVAKFSARLGRSPIKTARRPVPGGNGYGVSYDSSFRTDYTTGTGICWDIVCPNPPGGNVSTTLYLTATNRSALGVEALVAYDGQQEATFWAFDWSRYPSAPWQAGTFFSDLAGHFMTESAHGHSYKTLMLTNMTFQTRTGHWKNQVLLWNDGHRHWELVYEHNYSATLAQQKGLPVGTWGPTVETFESGYSGTRSMGALGTQMITGRSSGWGSWKNLTASQSSLDTMNEGFDLVFVDPNYQFVVKS